MKKLIWTIILIILTTSVIAAPIAETSSQITTTIDGSSENSPTPEPNGVGGSGSNRGSSAIICGNTTCGVGSVCENEVCVNIIEERKTEPIPEPIQENIPEEPTRVYYNNDTLPEETIEEPIKEKKDIKWSYLIITIILFTIMIILFLMWREDKKQAEMVKEIDEVLNE